MSLAVQIDSDLKDAMRSRDAARLGVLRMLKSALKYAAIEKLGAEGVLDDPDALPVIRKEIKKREDSIASYEKAERPDLADKERAEVLILSSYLPQGLTAEELAAIVRTAIAEVGATTRAHMGAVMKLAAAAADGRADGRTLSAEVQRQLGTG